MAIASFFLLLFGGNIVRRALGNGNDLDALIFGTFVLAVILGLVATLVRDARQLLLRGFQAGEVRDALRAITAEEDDNRAQLRANAAYVKRLRVRRWMSVAFLVLAVAAFAFALSTQRTLLSPGMYGMSRPGIADGRRRHRDVRHGAGDVHDEFAAGAAARAAGDEACRAARRDACCSGLPRGSCPRPTSRSPSPVRSADGDPAPCSSR